MQNTNDQLLTALKKADSVLLEISEAIRTGQYARRESYHKSVIDTVRNDHHSLICDVCRERNRVGPPAKQKSGELELHGSIEMMQLIMNCIEVNDMLSTRLRYSHQRTDLDRATITIDSELASIVALKVMSHGHLFGSRELLRNATLYMQAVIGKSPKPPL